jgi:hypothetical protein
MADLASALLAGTRKKKFHEMLAEQASSTAPTAHWGAALARALQGGMAGLIERGERDSDGAEFDKLFGPQAAAPQPTMQAQPAIQPTQPEQKPSLVASLAGKRPVQVIEGNAETQPSPLDPPSGQDRDLAIRTMYGEDPNASALGVANVIRRRAIDGNYGGSTPSQVVMAKGQFEPWARPDAKARMMGLSPDSPTYQRLGQTLDQAYAGDDPTGGATHFYAPKAQAALGRQAPSWDKGPSTTIGPHKFLGGVDQGAMPPEAQLAQAQMPPQMAPQQPAARAAPQIPPHIMGQARQLWQEGNRSAAAALMQPYMTPKDQWELTPSPVPGDKNMYQRNRGSNELKPLNPQPFAVNVNNQAESKFKEKAGELQAKRFDELAGEATGAKQMQSDVAMLRDLGDKIKTGKIAEVKAVIGPYADALGIKVEGLNEIQAFEAVLNRVAPQLRVKGTGAQSDFELRNFLKQMPQIGNTPEGNALIEKTMQGFIQNKLSAAEIASDALNDAIDRKEADKRLRELPDPMAEWREFNKKSKADAVQVIDGYKIRAK